MTPELKKRLAMAAGLVAIALAAIPVLDSMSGKKPDTTPTSVPVSSGRIVNKEAASEPTLVIAQLPESSAPAAASTPAIATPSPATPDLGKTPAANLGQTSPLPATAAPATPAIATATPAGKTSSPAPAPASKATPPAATATATKQATPPAAPAIAKATTPSPAPAVARSSGKTSPVSEIELPPAAAPAPQAASRAPMPTLPAVKAAPGGASLGYQVQLGLFASPGNAEKLLDDLKKRGISARTETRVQLGPFNTRAEAEEAMAKLKALGYQPLLVPAGAH